MEQLNKELTLLKASLHLVHRAMRDMDSGMDNPYADCSPKELEGFYRQYIRNYEKFKQQKGVEYCDDCRTLKRVDQIIDLVNTEPCRQRVCRKCTLQCAGCKKNYLVNNEMHRNYETSICPHCKNVKIHIEALSTTQLITGPAIEGEIISA